MLRRFYPLSFLFSIEKVQNFHLETTRFRQFTEYTPGHAKARPRRNRRGRADFLYQIFPGRWDYRPPCSFWSRSSSRWTVKMAWSRRS